MMTGMIDPPRYFWLWHLAALKVIDADFGPAPGAVPPHDVSALWVQAAPVITATLWDSIAQAGTVTPLAPLRLESGLNRNAARAFCADYASIGLHGAARLCGLK